MLVNGSHLWLPARHTLLLAFQQPGHIGAAANTEAEMMPERGAVCLVDTARSKRASNCWECSPGR
jgi:hypothetical protein